MTTESTQIPGNPAAPLLCPIDDTGLIEVAGSDAEAFLNAQFSCDMDAAPPPRATLAGWHDARGRVLALLWALWTGERWLLLVRGGDTNALVRRLAMFVLRADVRLRDAAPAWQAAALAGGIDEWSATPFAMPGTRPGDVAEAHGAFAIRAGPRLAYLAAPRGAFEAVRAKFSAGPAEAATIEEIRLGLVNLIPDLSARYTAHMLNLDRLGALAFDKGCYPGQEIIARTQNLGAAKRRVFRFSGALRQVPGSRQSAARRRWQPRRRGGPRRRRRHRRRAACRGFGRYGLERPGLRRCAGHSADAERAARRTRPAVNCPADEP